MAGSREWDIAVVGGGAAGCATVLSLARGGVTTVGLIAMPPSPGPRIGESIPPDTRVLLRAIGVWEPFLRQGHEPCLGSASAWGSDALGYNDFVLNPYGAGWHLDRARFDALLWKEAKGTGVDLLKARLVNAERAAGGLLLRCASADGAIVEVRARIAVDATGPRTALARRLGAAPSQLDRLLFVYGFFSTSDAIGIGRLTLLEAEAAGWWYAAALPAGRLAVAFAGDPDWIRRERLTTPDRWLARLLGTRHLAGRLDGYRFLPEKTLVRPAHSCMLEPAACDTWLAVGDAASVFDPIAAQGIYKALDDGIRAADAIRAGDGGAAYRAETGSRFETYLANRNYMYGLEQRWPESPFWGRRHARTALPDAVHGAEP